MTYQAETHVNTRQTYQTERSGTNFGQLFSLLAPQLALRPHLPKPGNDRTHLAFEKAQDPVVHKAQGLLLIATVEQMRGVPSPWGGMPQVEHCNRLGRWEHTLAG